MEPIDACEIDVPMLLMRRAHRLELRRYVARHDAIGMRYPAVDSLAGGDPDQLARGGDNGGLRLPERIFDERSRDDKTHLVGHAIEAAERVEHAVAPQELIGGGRKFIAVGTELEV